MPKEGKNKHMEGKQDLAVMYMRGRDSDNKEKEGKRVEEGIGENTGMKETFPLTKFPLFAIRGIFFSPTP